MSTSSIRTFHFAAFLLLALSTALLGCGGDQAAEAASQSVDTPQETAAPQDPAAEPVAKPAAKAKKPAATPATQAPADAATPKAEAAAGNKSGDAAKPTAQKKKKKRAR